MSSKGNCEVCVSFCCTNANCCGRDVYCLRTLKHYLHDEEFVRCVCPNCYGTLQVDMQYTKDAKTECSSHPDYKQKRRPKQC